MSIQLTFHGENAREVIKELLTFSDFYVNPSLRVGVAVEETDTSDLHEHRETVVAVNESRISQIAAGQNIITREGQTGAPQRERGKPAPGKSRRTAEEVAEDRAADEADAARDAAAKDAGIQTESAADVKAAISTGEERNHPEDPQDAADEKAEVEANRDADQPLTIDDIKGALGEYLKMYGMPAAQQDGPKVIKLALGTDAPPDAAGQPQDWRMSLVPTDQDSLAKVLGGIKEMLAKNPFKREPVNSVLG